MKKIYFSILTLLISLLSFSQSDFMTANNSNSRNRYEIYVQTSPASPDASRQYAFAIKGLATCYFYTTDIYMSKFATSGDKVILANSSGNLTSLPLSDFQYTSGSGITKTGNNFTADTSVLMPRSVAEDSITAINDRIDLKADGSDVYSKTESDSRYMQSYTETDPVWISQKASYSTKAVADGLYKAIGYVPDWSDITSKPTLFSGAYNDLTGKPTLFDGNYNSLSNLPSLFNGVFSSLTGKPTTLSGYGISDAYPISGNPSGFLTAEVDGSVTNEIELPTQVGQSGKYLTTNGSATNWATLPAAAGTNNASGYSSGTQYALTTTSAKVDFGTTDPVITIPTAGTYLIFSNLTIDYSGVTTLATAACNFKLRRTNNTPADIPSAATAFNVPVLTLLTATGGDSDMPPIIYTTSNNNDIIELWGSRGNNVSAGSINISQANVVAIRIY